MLLHMKLSLYQVDAFTSTLFGGNPAAVCPLQEWLPDDLMQRIAMENNLSETAFFIRKDNRFSIRWFTPVSEVALCGHATLASAHVIFHHLGYGPGLILFDSKSGELRVTRKNDLLVLDFPADDAKPIAAPAGLFEAMGSEPVECHKGRTDVMLVYKSEEEIIALSPDFKKLAGAGVRGVIVTAPGKASDFVSRFFAPAVGVDEDPVTGSAHTTLIPYWAKRLGKNELSAIQCSRRRGTLTCTYNGNRLEIGGQAITYLTGETEI